MEIYPIRMTFGSNNQMTIIMKRISMMFAVISLIVTASCSTVEMSHDVSVRNLVPLSIESGEKASQQAGLKTSLSGTDVHWTEGDAVAVFDKLNYKNEFPSVAVNGSSARFEGQVENGTTEFYAVYPFSRALSADASNLYVNLPSDQTPASGTFAEEMNISVAAGHKTPGTPEVSGLMFRNVCGLVYFTVPAHLKAVSEVVFKAENRVLAGELTIAKSDAQTVTGVSSGSNSVSMAGDFAAGSTFYFVVAPGEVNGFSITVKTRNGATFTNSSVKSFALSAGGMKNLGTISFKPEFNSEAKHVYSNGVLTGTQVDVSFGMPAGMEEYVEGVEIKVLNSSNAVVRQFSSNAAVADIVLGKDHGQIYLPQGKYQVAYTYVMNGVAKTEKREITVPAPVFTGTVSVSGVTSYSLSKTDVNAANNYTEDRIGDIVLNCIANNGISSDVLSEFPLSYSVLLDGSTEILSGTSNTQNNIKAGEKKNIAWGQHTLKAKVSFDGQTIEGTSGVLYITGLPYIENLTKNTTGWTNFNNVETDGKCFIFNTDAASVLSPRFSFPNGVSVNTKATLNVYAYHTNATASYKPTLYVNASSTPIHAAQGSSASVSASIKVMDAGGDPVNKSFDLSMSNSAANLSIYVYGKKNKGWLSGPDYPEFFIKKCSILYR